MSYGLPKSVDIDGQEFAIRYDYRVILDIFEAMNDPDSSEEDRALDVLQIFYVDFDELTDYDAAMKEVFRFINGGEEPRKQKGPHLVDWPMDFPRIIAPINRVLGYEARAVDYDIETNTGG
ncbi:Gp15 family bacteriophage protein, partial [Flavonifractor plautii]